DSVLTLGAVVQVRASGTPAPNPVPVVFVGRITDITVSWSDAGMPQVDVIAGDMLGDLANRFVGAEPWAAELMWQRVTRVLAAVGLDYMALGTIVNRPAALQVSRVDVDRQDAAALLFDLAVPSGTVLVAAGRTTADTGTQGGG